MKMNDYDEAFASFWNSFGSGRHMVLSTACGDRVSSRMMSVVNIDGCLYPTLARRLHLPSRVKDGDELLKK